MPWFLDHFRLVAPHYDRIFSYDSDHRLLEHLQLPEQGWLLDAGGGTGRVTQTLRDPSNDVVIVDENAGMLIEARNKGFTTVQGEIEALPFRSSAFPRVLTVDTIHHLRDQLTATREMMRALAPGGRVVVQEPDIKHIGVKLTALAEKLMMMRSRFQGPGSLRPMFESAGGQVSIHEGGTHFWLIAEKETEL